MRLTKIFILTIATILLSLKSSSQFQSQRNEIFAYNILSNGITCGISGAINKGKNEKVLPVFFKNFGKGCLGGLVKYSAKNQTYYLNNSSNTHFALLNRAFFFAGHSMSMNASMNEKLLEKYYLNLYGLNMVYQPKASDHPKFQVRASLGTLTALIYFSFRGHKLDFYKSLEYGQFYHDFKRDGLRTLDGQASYNVFAIRKFDKGRTAMAVIPHEIVHTYQNYDFFLISNMYKKKLDPILTNCRLYNFASKYVSLDYEGAFFWAAYGLQSEPRYYQNFFEYEAEHFSRRNYISR